MRPNRTEIRSGSRSSGKSSSCLRGQDRVTSSPKKATKKALEVLVKQYLEVRTWGSLGECPWFPASSKGIEKGFVLFLGG